MTITFDDLVGKQELNLARGIMERKEGLIQKYLPEESDYSKARSEGVFLAKLYLYVVAEHDDPGKFFLEQSDIIFLQKFVFHKVYKSTFLATINAALTDEEKVKAFCNLIHQNFRVQNSGSEDSRGMETFHNFYAAWNTIYSGLTEAQQNKYCNFVYPIRKHLKCIPSDWARFESEYKKLPLRFEDLDGVVIGLTDNGGVQRETGLIEHNLNHEFHGERAFLSKLYLYLVSEQAEPDSFFSDPDDILFSKHFVLYNVPREQFLIAINAAPTHTEKVKAFCKLIDAKFRVFKKPDQTERFHDFYVNGWMASCVYPKDKTEAQKIQYCNHVYQLRAKHCKYIPGNWDTFEKEYNKIPQEELNRPAHSDHEDENRPVQNNSTAIIIAAMEKAYSSLSTKAHLATSGYDAKQSALRSQLEEFRRSGSKDSLKSFITIASTARSSSFDFLGLGWFTSAFGKTASMNAFNAALTDEAKAEVSHLTI